MLLPEASFDVIIQKLRQSNETVFLIHTVNRYDLLGSIEISLVVQPPSELLLELFASSVALTPWREGFDRPVDKAFPTEIHAFLVAVYQRDRGGYFIVDAGNNIFRFDNGRKLDLSAWFLKNINPFTKPAVDSNAPFKIDLSLPEPFQNLKIRVDITVLSITTDFN